MVPDTNRTPDADEESGTPAQPDGGPMHDLDEAALYGIVRGAVEDALLSVIGTVLLIGTAFVIVAIGAQVALQSDSVASATIGVAIVVVGFYLAAATLEIIPPIRNWF